MSEFQKVIFLDIDGVLNRHIPRSNGFCGIDQDKAEILNHVLCAIPDCGIVVSSSWRYLVHGGRMTISGFEDLMLICGLCCKGRIIDVTAMDESIKGREEQIRAWIDGRPYIKNFVIIDDIAISGFDKHFFSTKPEDGITSEMAEKIIQFLFTK